MKIYDSENKFVKFNNRQNDREKIPKKEIHLKSKSERKGIKTILKQYL